MPTLGADSPLPGFRLRRLEMLNWGTFHHKVAIITLAGRWTLLVGENGSGKSTAVDALRTLLVPPRLLNYNDASGEQKRRDRTRRSYVRGAWATSSREDTAAARLEYLRKDGEQSILLAVFADEHGGTEVTLAQIIWDMNERVDEVFAVTRGDRNIREHLSNLGKTNELKKALRSRGFEPFDSFSGYETAFRKRLGIPNHGALEVFNQAIGVKEVTDVNSFIRRHMLEPSDAMEFINNRLRPHYKELDACWQAIKKAKVQIQKLQPIAECHGRIEEAKQRKAELEDLQQVAPLYYARRHLDLRLGADAELEVHITEVNGNKADLQAEQERDSQERDNRLRELAANSVEQSVQRLEALIRDTSLLKQQKEQRHKKLKENLTILGKSTQVESEDLFNKLRQTIISDKVLIEENLNSSDAKMLEFKLERAEALKKREEVAADLESLRRHRVLIPREFVAIRLAISQATDVAVAELPFAGELMEVKSEFREWTGAIERLLHSFGISLLVPEQYYMSITTFINEHRLMHENQGVRLTYYRVPTQIQTPRIDILTDPECVPGRLNFRKEHSLHPWVKIELSRRFTHVCCTDVQRLKQQDYGITREGLIRNGPTQHIKDDRRVVNDIANYVLGWSTEAKIRALTTQYESAETRATEAGKRAQQEEEQIKKLKEHLAAIAEVTAVERFAQVDFRSEQQVIVRLLEEKEILEASSDKYRELKKQLEAAIKRIQERDKSIVRLAERIGGLITEQKQNQEAYESLQAQLAPHVELDLDVFSASLLELQEEKTLTLKNVLEVAESVARRIQSRVNQQTSAISKQLEDMLPKMTNFLRDYPEESANLKPEADYAAEFVALGERIRNDELPKHEQRFEEFLGTNLIGDMAMFNTTLGEHEKDIRARIGSVNQALRTIPFSNSTYVQVVINPNRSDEIRIFRAGLKSCLSGGLHPSPDDRVRIFGQIRELISKFEKDENWTRRVTDARNWLEFGVREVADPDGREVNYYAASSGKSGGQKTKLAFTILASAITAQYGLIGAGDESCAFRLVVIDEAFARTDEANSKRALDLFKSLGLQLLVVSPFDAKGRIVEDYVDSFHLVINPEGNGSQIRRASRSEYEAVREETIPGNDAQLG